MSEPQTAGSIAPRSDRARHILAESGTDVNMCHQCGVRRDVCRFDAIQVR